MAGLETCGLFLVENDGKAVAAVEGFLKTRGVAGYQVTVTPYGSEHHDLAGYYKRPGFASDGRVILFKSLA